MFQWGVRIRPWLAAVLVLAVPAVGAPTASAEPRPASPRPAAAPNAYAIGDSVMLGAKSQLRKRGIAVNATVSRQAYSAPAMVRKRSSSLPRNLVVHLGTNGTFPLDTCKRLVRNAGAQRHVYLVTVSVPRSWEKSNNRTLRKCAGSFPASRVTLVDWKGLASRNPAWFYSDGVHLKSAGAVGFARLIDRAISGSP